MIPLPRDAELQPASTVPIKKEEAREQARLVAALRFCWSKIFDDSERPIVFHIPNGGQRDAREGANLKTQGVLSGVPDLEIICPGGKTFRIEMKAKDGRESVAQVQLREHMRALGHLVFVAYSAEGALAELRKHND